MSYPIEVRLLAIMKDIDPAHIYYCDCGGGSATYGDFEVRRSTLGHILVDKIDGISYFTVISPQRLEVILNGEK